MKLFGSVRYLILVLLVVYSTEEIYSQDQLFQSDSILEISISGNLKPVLSDKSIYPVYFSQRLRFLDPMSGEQQDMAVELKARGNFRRLKADCKHLPLMLRFSEDLNTKGTVFHKQRKLKLVLPCKGTSYVFKEWLAYKIYNIINPAYSFKTRIIRINFLDTNNGLTEEGVLGFIIEDEKRLATRNKMSVDEGIVVAEAVDKETYLNMVLFQYMIGNTDWSIPFLHNMKVIRKDSLSTPVIIPYDFDHAGMVNAPYAIPPPPLEMESVLERLYRGYCLDDISEMDKSVERFQNLKDEIYKLVLNAKFIDQTEIEEAIAYLDEFYKIINDPEARRTVLMSPCLPESKANIEIMGLGY